MEKSSKRPYVRPPTGGSLKDQLTKILQEEDLSRKLKFLRAFAEETSADMEQLAGALLVLIEKQRPAPYRPSTRKAFGQDRNQTGQRSEVRFESKRTFQSKEGRPHRPPPGPMTKYRIEVGRVHGIRPGQIVGAIANESSLSGADIGGIDIQTHFSTVDLPQSMSDDVIHELRELRIAGQPLRLSKWERGGDGRLREKPARFQKKKGAKPSWKKSRKRLAPPTSN